MSQGVVILRATHIAPDPRVEKIGRVLARAGYAVQALGWDRNGNLPAEESGAGFPIRRIRLLAPWQSGIRNLAGLLRWQLALVRWLGEHRERYQVIHACDFDTLLPALWAKSRWGKQVVYDIFDFYADMLRKTPALLVSAARRLELWGMGRADAVILADDARWEQVRGAKPRRRAVIYNSPEDQQPELPEKPSTERAQRLRLAYVGLMQVERGLLPLIQLVAAHPEWSLDLAGSGAEQDEILAAAGGLPNITYHGQVPYRRALELNAGADVLPALYDPAIANHRFASPNKLFEGMLLGKPVVGARGTNVDRIIEQEACGEVMTYGVWEELESALQRLEDAAYRAQLGRNARRAYEQTYGWERMAERLTALYAEVTAGAPGEGKKP